ncbi:MAG: PqqD family peptide modification chaperone [Desulfuromonadales bacterium]
MPNSGLKIDMDTRLAVNPGLVLRIEDDDCALLFDPDNGKVQMLNSTAVAVWQLLDGQRTLSQVVDCLGSMYEGIDDATARQVLGLMESLAKLGAVGVWEQD